MATVAEIIAERLIAEMESGVIPWAKPWVAAGSCMRRNGQPYSLLNHLLLGRPGEYLTWKQIVAEGGKVREREEEKWSMVVHWNPPKKKSYTKTNAEGEEETIEYWKRGSLSYFRVYHIDQTEGIEPHYAIMPQTHAEPEAEAEALIAEYIRKSGVTLHRDDPEDRAFYSPFFDAVTVPAMRQFAATAEYYSTLFHELTHSTGHESRLNRIKDNAAFGSQDYSVEELIAEIGAATLCNKCGIDTEKSVRNSAAYLQSWLKALRNDKSMIVTAAGAAGKAVDFICG